MSLLMDALKKAEEAKKASNSPAQNENLEVHNAITNTATIKTATGADNANTVNVTKKSALEIAVSSRSKDNLKIELETQESESESEPNPKPEYSPIDNPDPSAPNTKQSDMIQPLYDGFTTPPQSEPFTLELQTEEKPENRIFKSSSDDRNTGTTSQDQQSIESDTLSGAFTKNESTQTNKLETTSISTAVAHEKISQPVAPQSLQKRSKKRVKPQTIIYASATLIVVLISGSAYQYYQFLTQDYESQFAAPLNGELFLPLPINPAITHNKTETTQNAANTTSLNSVNPQIPELIPTKSIESVIPPVLTVKTQGLKPTAETNVTTVQKSPEILPSEPSVKRQPIKQTKKSDAAEKITIPEELADKQTILSIQTEPADVYSILQQAYSSFTQGDFTGAQKNYKQALAIDPSSRDALLGLAAIAVQEKDFLIARQIYVKILQSDPGDTIANAALINIQSNIDPIKNETQIKLLLGQHPDSPHLLFALGSLYISQQRWADAHNAFLKAFQSQPKNADYAYNLAITYDHMGQRDSARRYYRTALVSANSQNINFSIEKVLKRINALSK